MSEAHRAISPYLVPRNGPHDDLRDRAAGLAYGFAGERRWAEPATLWIAYPDAAAGPDDLADRCTDPNAHAEIVRSSDADPVGRPEPSTERRSG